MTQRRRLITEFESEVNPNYRLGRHINHDERSKAFVAKQATTLRSVSHRHYGAPLDQGPVGACTGFTDADWLNCLPSHKAKAKMFRNPDGWTFYSEATKIDPFQGEWIYPPPPGSGQDTGSDGLDACKVLKNLGLISGYDHAFGIDQALAALVLSPVMVGVPWYEGFDHPDPKGLVKIDGNVRGGHEFCLLGLDVKLERVKALNHWGPNYGLNGIFYFSFDDLDALLSNQGDCTVPRV